MNLPLRTLKVKTLLFFESFLYFCGSLQNSLTDQSIISGSQFLLVHRVFIIMSGNLGKPFGRNRGHFSHIFSLRDFGVQNTIWRFGQVNQGGIGMKLQNHRIAHCFVQSICSQYRRVCKQACRDTLS